MLSLCAIRATAGVVGVRDEFPEGYVPPLLANGDVSLTLDCSCGMQDRRYCGISPEIYRAGRRLALPSAGLVGMGRLKPIVVVDGKVCVWPEKWNQTLDVENARVLIDGVYGGGVRIQSEAFVCEAMPVVCVRRVLSNECAKTVRVTSGMGLAAPDIQQVVGKWNPAGDGAWDFDYRLFGHRLVNGSTRIALNPGSQNVDRGEDGLSRSLVETFDLKPSERREQTSFVVFADDFEAGGAQVADKIALRTKTICELGFDGLFEIHRKAWGRYYAESSVRIPDARMQRMYDVAQYHLKCNATRWSFPVGLFPHHWQGRYFGFDEMYAHQGLASSGHFDLARRCPEFRFSTLKTAKMRCGHYTPDGGEYGARWCWESIEDGLNECAPQGFWYDHVFHQGTIARTAWTQYLFTGDVGYLRDVGYPVIRECARFFLANWVYEDSDGSAYIGKCTDLERLGPSRDRPFMTTCGAVYAMRAAAEAADALGVDSAEAARFREVADRLVAGLPVSEGRYLPYRGCTEESVAVLAGLYPFPVFDATNELQSAAAWHFARNGRTGGNMYPLGKGTCPWYAAKMAIAMTLLGERVEPVRWLSEASQDQGLFGETYEIGEPGHRRTPWFATASGCVVEAVNTMLLATHGGELHVCAATPSEWKDCSFVLPAYGGLVVDCEIAGGEVCRLSVAARNGSQKPVRLVLPDGSRRTVKTPWVLR